MAEAAAILEVQDLLPNEAEEDGWDEEKIADYLDGGKSISSLIQTYWESKAAKYHTAISISESGSSRDLSRLFDNAQRMAEYWRDRVKAEEDEADDELNGRLRFNKITRI